MSKLSNFLIYGFILSAALITAQEQAEPVETIINEEYGLNLKAGNLHSHTKHSDGRGTPEENLQWAKEIQGYDINVITDHAMQLTQKDWRENREAAEASNRSDGDRFLALVGFEWTSRVFNHVNVYFTDDFISAPLLPNLEKFYMWADERDAVIEFNHPRAEYKKNTNWRHFKFYPGLYDNVTMMELANGKRRTVQSGYYLKEYINALDKGWFLAPASNRDNHNLEPTVDDVTILLLEEFTPESIEKSIRSRKIFATDDPELLVLFRYGSILMGSDRLAPAEGSAFTVNYSSADPVKRVALLSNGGEVLAELKNQPAGDILWQPEVEAEAGQWYVVVIETEEAAAVSAPLLFNR